MALPNPRSLERELRRQIQGRHLIAEIGLTEELRDTLIETFRLRGSYALHHASGLAVQYPALLVTYLTAEGVFSYRDGTFWRYCQIKWINRRAAPSFRTALARLGLPTFEDVVEDERARTYLTPILLHGGIPRSCLPDFFQLLERHPKARSAARLLDCVKNDRELWGSATSRPIQRFLRYGGDFADDFVERAQRLRQATLSSGRPPSPERVGLPNYVVRACADLVRAGWAHLPVVRRPRVRLDYRTDHPVVLELPSASVAPAVEWQVLDGRTVRRPAGGSPVPLRPNPTWVAKRYDHEPITVPQEEHPFSGVVSPGVVLFDPRSLELVGQHRSVKGSEIWMLLAPRVEVSAHDRRGRPARIRVIEEIADLTGDWSGYRLQLLSLGGIAGLAFSGALNARQHVVRVDAAEEAANQSTHQARPAGPIKPQVICQYPRLQWAVSQGDRKSSPFKQGAVKLSRSDLHPGSKYRVERLYLVLTEAPPPPRLEIHDEETCLQRLPPPRPGRGDGVWMFSLGPAWDRVRTRRGSLRLRLRMPNGSIVTIGAILPEET